MIGWHWQCARNNPFVLTCSENCTQLGTTAPPEYHGGGEKKVVCDAALQQLCATVLLILTARVQVWQRKQLAAKSTHTLPCHILSSQASFSAVINTCAYLSVVHCRTGKVVGCWTSVLDVGALTSDRMLLSKLRMTCCCDARCSARELVGAQPPVQVLLCSMSTVINALAHRELPG